MISDLAKGDLVFIPSEVTLLQFDNSSRSKSEHPNKWLKTKKPAHALLARNEKGSYYKILYEGQYWFVDKSNVYECR
jgi:hypothetical protein